MEKRSLNVAVASLGSCPNALSGAASISASAVLARIWGLLFGRTTTRTAYAARAAFSDGTFPSASRNARTCDINFDAVSRSSAFSASRHAINLFSDSRMRVSESPSDRVIAALEKYLSLSGLTCLLKLANYLCFPAMPPRPIRLSDNQLAIIQRAAGSIVGRPTAA
jgi:hypothetical protein